jgi:hypothetical protein
VLEDGFEDAHRRRTAIAAAEVVAALEALGIRSILLKGPSIGRWLYEEGESGQGSRLHPPPAPSRHPNSRGFLAWRSARCLELDSQ